MNPAADQPPAPAPDPLDVSASAAAALESRIARLPRDIRRYIQLLRQREQTLTQLLPWAHRQAEWFTLFHPDTRTPGHTDQQPIRLFTCSAEGTRCIASIGPRDLVFVGRQNPAS